MAESTTQDCQGVPSFPSWIKSSETYRNLFNKVATELGYPIEWTGDVAGGSTNIPDLNELRVGGGG
ncbi:MAG: hypothetical protein Q7S98_03410, partial [Deltaproteobacteria bacterium]|nr:hypothetical protein [Deltaproteobacteria bacterium]